MRLLLCLLGFLLSILTSSLDKNPGDETAHARFQAVCILQYMQFNIYKVLTPLGTIRLEKPTKFSAMRSYESVMINMERKNQFRAVVSVSCSAVIELSNYTDRR